MRLERLVRIANHAKTDTQKNKVGNALLKLMDDIECTPERMLYKRNKDTLKITQGVNALGKGAYGVVFYGCLDDECKTRVAIKFSQKSLQTEYIIGKKLANLGVAPRVYRYGFCPTKGLEFMYYEYASRGSLDAFVKKYASKLTASDYKAILYQVYTMLRKVHKKYPSYRHYDLHPGNVLVNKERGKFRMLLTDFGMSEMRGIRSPLLPKVWRREQAADAFVFTFYLGEHVGAKGPSTAVAFFKDFAKRTYTPKESSVKVISDAMTYPFMKGARKAVLHV